MFEIEGYGEIQPTARALTKEGRWDALAAEVPDDLLQACAAVAQHDELASAVAARFGGLSDSLPLSASSEQPAEVPERVIAALRRIPSGAG